MRFENQNVLKSIMVFFLVFSTLNSYSQTYKNKYKKLLEPNSTLIDSGFDYTIEKINSKKYIFKRYFPENKQIILFATYSDSKLDVRHGDFVGRYDDGEIVYMGTYFNNLKVGEWIEMMEGKGHYKEGLKEGKWIKHDFKDRLSSELNYTKGKLDSVQVYFDTLGNIKYKEVFDLGQLISTTRDTTVTSTDVMPRFYGCEELNLPDVEKKKCADNKMLEYIYGRIKYPRKAKLQQIQGTALIRFVVEEDGSVTNVKVLWGLTKEIKEECIKVIKGMPRWTPGKQNGKAVEVQFNLPIKFRLE